MTIMTGDNLVSRAKAGDRSAFDELVGPLVDQGFRLAFGMLHDREAAEDAVQEATVRITALELTRAPVEPGRESAQGAEP
jgi:DNA-directed RNA polymerase specialized sigma24 family protein